MLATCNITAVPLDLKDPTVSPSTFEVQIVTDLQFSPGEHTEAEIKSVLALHPILGAPQPSTLPAYLVGYDAWEKGGAQHHTSGSALGGSQICGAWSPRAPCPPGSSAI